MAKTKKTISECEDIIDPSRHCHIVDLNGDKIYYGAFGRRPDYVNNLTVKELSPGKSTRGSYLRIVVDMYWNTFGD